VLTANNQNSQTFAENVTGTWQINRVSFNALAPT